MKTNLYRGAVVVLLLAAITVGGFFARAQWQRNEPLEIIAVNKTNYNSSMFFWEVVRAGMDQAIEEFDVTMTFMHPEFESQIEEQKSFIDEAIERQPDAIILVASDYSAIGPYAEKIINKGIELILLDSDVSLPEKADVPFVGTNNLKAGEYLGSLAKEENAAAEKALILAHFYGVKTSDDREQGIRTGFGEDRITATYSCDSDEEIAYRYTAETLQRDPDVTVVFGTNEFVTIGAAKAIEELALQDRVQLYGFDGSREHIQFLEKGVVDCTVIQSPYQMGYLAVVNAVKRIRGEEVEAFVETDYLPITIENMYEAGYREILFPLNMDAE